uniref:AlNc14C124G6758 protein n=1 Tax=Albugo laibachii Nc14 TaxID=890382 RepID=F0WJN3_9STRA|nr:AlNc14C124G6758 [Albugo laibachii Nc14]|eukprot:CCA21483.1 AlNc14C124G6758 [Albugo laibachii Nc14]
MSFSLKAKQDDLLLTSSVLKEDQNDMPSTSTSAHPVHLRLVKEMEETIVGLYDAGIPTRSIQTCLRKDPELILLKSKLKNVRQPSSYKALDGRTPMDVLVKKFCGLEFDVEKIVNDYDGCISQLFSANPR